MTVKRPHAGGSILKSSMRTHILQDILLVVDLPICVALNYDTFLCPLHYPFSFPEINQSIPFNGLVHCSLNRIVTARFRFRAQLCCESLSSLTYYGDSSARYTSRREKIMWKMCPVDHALGQLGPLNPRA